MLTFQSVLKMYTRVPGLYYIDATEIRVQKPTLSEFQQMTFSNYKNTNMYKVLIGISPSGAITFASKVYPGAISDTELTIKCGILDLLNSGDSLMANRGFTIQNELILIGIKLNIPPLLCGKTQLSGKEMVETRRIVSLRIHVERAMERIKIFISSIEHYHQHLRLQLNK